MWICLVGLLEKKNWLSIKIPLLHQNCPWWNPELLGGPNSYFQRRGCMHSTYYTQIPTTTTTQDFHNTSFSINCIHSLIWIWCRYVYTKIQKQWEAVKASYAWGAQVSKDPWSLICKCMWQKQLSFEFNYVQINALLAIFSRNYSILICSVARLKWLGHIHKMNIVEFCKIILQWTQHWEALPMVDPGLHSEDVMDQAFLHLDCWLSMRSPCRSLCLLQIEFHSSNQRRWGGHKHST